MEEKEKHIRVEMTVHINKEDKCKLELEGLDYEETTKRVIELLSYGYGKK